MDSTFELNKLGWFTVEAVEPNDFLNQKLDNDQYGIWYSVKFEGDANTHLWQAKSAPEKGERVYGHIEKTKSGKTTKFRRAKKDEMPQEGSQASITPGAPAKEWKSDEEFYGDKNAQIKAQWAIGKAVAYGAKLNIGGSTPAGSDEIEYVATKLFAMVDRVKGSSESTNPKVPNQESSLTRENSTRTIASQTTSITGTSGYDKFKASKPQVDDAESVSLYQSIAGSEPVYVPDEQ